VETKAGNKFSTKNNDNHDNRCKQTNTNFIKIVIYDLSMTKNIWIYTIIHNNKGDII
jgi:hypothetical protein